MSTQPLTPIPQATQNSDVPFTPLYDSSGRDIGLTTERYQSPKPAPLPVHSSTIDLMNMPVAVSSSTPAGHSRVVAYPGGHSVAFPDSLDDNSFQAAAKRSWDFLKTGAGALGQSFGLPTGSKAEFDAANAQLSDQLAHPLRSMKEIGQSVINSLNNSDLLEKAKNAPTTAEKVQHILNYALPLLGHASDEAGTELTHQQYAEAVGHLVGLGLQTVAGTKGEGAEEVYRAKPKATPESPVKSAEPVKPATPLSDVDRSAAAFLRKQRVTGVPKVEVVGTSEAPETAIAGRTVRTRGAEQKPTAVSPDEANKLATDVLQNTKPTEGVRIENESETPKTTAEAADALARSYVTKLQKESGAPLRDVATRPALPTPAKPTSPVLDLTDDWKQAAQKELARQGASGGSDAMVPAFYSKAERVANAKVPNSAPGDQILATLKNNGVKQDELDWMGLDDYLKGKPKVSKANLQAYINEHKISLDEVDRGTQRQQLQAQRDKVYAEQNKLWEQLRYPREDGGITIGQWLRSADEAKAEAIKTGAISPELATQFKHFDDLTERLGKLDMQKATLQEKPVRYEQYTLPGDKSNYAEKLLTLPEKDNMADVRAQFVKVDEERTHYLQTLRPVPGNVELRFHDLQKQLRQAENKSTAFKSPHFDEPNILAHVRFDDRPAVDGKKTLFLEELQSDWAQAGKRHGFQTADAERANQEFDTFRQSLEQKYGTPAFWDKVTPEERQQYDQLVERANAATANKKTIPDMPFKQTWHELALKRMLRHAAENGYDSMSWVTGDQTAERYDLSKQVDEIRATKAKDNGKYSVTAFKDGSPVNKESDLEESKLADFIGKDLAQKVASQSTGKQYSYSGVDLKVGGEWAHNLYDKAIPQFLSKYAKKWNAKVGTIKLKDGTTVHSVPITPEMKRSLLTEGQPIAQARPSWADGIKDLARPQAA